MTGRRKGRRLLPLVLAVAALPAVVALADEDDHERAYRLRRAGEILPLSRILEQAEQVQPGRVIEVELERERGTEVYELEVLDGEGRLWELLFDARSGELLARRPERD